MIACIVFRELCRMSIFFYASMVLAKSQRVSLETNGVKDLIKNTKIEFKTPKTSNKNYYAHKNRLLEYTTTRSEIILSPNKIESRVFV